MDMDYYSDRGVTNSTLWTYKPSSLFNEIHWAVWGKCKDGKPKGAAGDSSCGGGKGFGGDKGGCGGKGDEGGNGAP